MGIGVGVSVGMGVRVGVGVAVSVGGGCIVGSMTRRSGSVGVAVGSLNILSSSANSLAKLSGVGVAFGRGGRIRAAGVGRKVGEITGPGASAAGRVDKSTGVGANASEVGTGAVAALPAGLGVIGGAAGSGRDS